MKKEMKVWAMTLIAFWWLSPNQTNAQQDSIRTLRLDEVVVTATKFPKSVSETGKTIIIIDEKQLEQSSGKDLAHLLNEQAGVVINGANSNSGKDKSVYIRGAKTEHTLILIDGIPVSDPSGVGGAFDLRLFPLDQVERIEILKGSQSTLYGSDAIAGVINIITKKPGDKPIAGNAMIGYGSYNTLKGLAGVWGKADVLSYRVGYSRNQTDGISEAKDESGTGNFDKDGFTQNALHLKLGIDPTDKISIQPFVMYADFDGAYDGGAFADDPDAMFNSKLLNFGTLANYKVSRGALNLQYAHEQTDRTFKDAFGKFIYDGSFDHLETYLNYELGENYQLLVGISHQQWQMEDENATIENPLSNSTSPYLSFFVKNLNGFSAETGGRLVLHSVYGNTFTYSINPSYLIKRKVKVFTNYSTGFKAPTLNQLYGQFGANEDLLPEESNSLEGGVHYFANENFDTRITAFARKVKNEINYTTSYVNLDRQDDFGIEAEFNYRNEKLNASAYYAMVDGEVTTKTFTGTDTAYYNLFKRPKHTLGLSLGYQVTQACFVSANFQSFSKRKDLFFNLNTFSSELVDLDAYPLLDVYAAYKWSKYLKAFVQLNNLLDVDYQESYGYSTRGINAMVGLNLSL